MAGAMQHKLLDWYAANHRALPWKSTKDPYKIWLSEIILQQTRVAQGTPYYLKFIKAFPTVQDLAAAKEDNVLKLWEGLGYYSRARNLHAAAKTVVNDFDGVFPNNYQDLLRLKGVGEYTAAAIASFAFDEAIAVVDGNVYRVLSRIFGITEPIDTPQGKNLFKSIAQKELDKEHPADYNQAIMNFGALQCTPKNPNCNDCPFQNDCIAFKKEMIDLLPIKSKKIQKRDRFFNYFVFYDAQHIIINKRSDQDIWKNLYDFPMIESNKKLTSIAHLRKQSKIVDNALKQGQLVQITSNLKQVLTHQNISAQFILIELNSLKSMELDAKWTLILREELQHFAFPKIINTFFENEAKILLHQAE